MKNKKDRYYPVNAIRVCIDEYDGDIRGRIYSKMCEAPLPFQNCSEMFLRADKFFDDCGYPQSYQVKRNFRESESRVHYARPKILLGDKEIRSQTGKYRTVDILVRSRRQAGWQGKILENESEASAEFESEMELLRCLLKSGNRLRSAAETECREEGCEE